MGKSTRFAVDFKYATVPIMSNHNNQSERFAEAARAAECDPDEARWDKQLKAVVRHKPVPEKPE